MSKQLIPSSITGDGTSFAAGGSVLDHNFGAGEPYTLGVEEEYMLLDGETLDLVQHVEAVLEAAAGHELEPRVNPELMQSVLEIATPVCRTPAEVGARPEHVVRTRAYLTEADDWKEVGRAHGEVFGSVRPASSFLVVTSLLDPRWKVELEAEALVPE